MPLALGAIAEDFTGTADLEMATRRVRFLDEGQVAEPDIRLNKPGRT